MSTKYLINDDIRAQQVRLIREDGHQAGIVSTHEALNIALSVGLDLVMVSSTEVEPPVCKILNFGQLKYEQKKKDKKAKRHSKATAVVKELKLSPNISEHDYQVRVNQCKRFLGKGYKVKVLVQFRGREVTHANLGVELLLRLAKDVVDLGTYDAEPRLAGFMVHIMLSPGKNHRSPA